MALRETAWRVLAAELTSALHEERGSGERAAMHLISPYGARMNRVLLAGTLGPAEQVGRDPAQPFWRARLRDATGEVAATAGGFQPRAMAQLRADPSPRSVLLVGKVHLYRGGDGTAYVSVRAEALRALDEAELRAAVAEIVESTLDRLDLNERLRKEPSLPDAALRTEGIPMAWIRAARESIRLYPTIDPRTFRAGLRSALPVIEGRGGEPVPPAPIPPSVRVTPIEAPPARVREPPSVSERARESEFLSLLDELTEGSIDGYADYRELRERLSQRGMAEDATEAVLARLQEGGEVEEPITGKLRRAMEPPDA